MNNTTIKKKYGVMNKLNIAVVTLGSVFAVITGFLSLMDYFKSDYSLELTRLSSQVIISSEISQSTWLNITYKKEKIGTLYSTRYRLINSGRKPIESSAVLDPISIEFSENNKLINLIVGTKYPKNLSISSEINDENKIIIEFELLNNGEYVDFDIYSLQPLVFKSVEARIKNLVSIDYSDKEVFQSKLDKLNLYDQIFLPLSLFALISLIIKLKVGLKIRSRALSVGDYLGEPSNFSADFLKRYIEREFYPSILTTAEFEFLKQKIDSTDSSIPESINELSETVYQTVSEREIPVLFFYLVNFVFYFGWFILNSYVVFSKLA